MTLTGFGRKHTIPVGDEQDTRWILSHLLALSLVYSHSFLFRVPHTPDVGILPSILFCLTTASFGVVGGLGRSIRVGYIYHSCVPSFFITFFCISGILARGYRGRGFIVVVLDIRHPPRV